MKPNFVPPAQKLYGNPMEQSTAQMPHATAREYGGQAAGAGGLMTAIQPTVVATVPLREVATIYSGGTPSKANASFWEGNIPWVSPKDMGEDHISDAEDHISPEAVERSATKLVPATSILVVVRSGILVRKLPIGLTTRPVAFNQDIKALVVDETNFLPEFIFWFLRAAEPHVLAVGVKKGATVHSLSAGYLESLPVPVLPMDEQRRIVDILNHAASIRRLREEARAKAREIIPALFVEMFGDARANPNGWPIVHLETVSSIGSGVTKGRKLDGAQIIEVPYLRVANVQDGCLNLAEIKTIPIRVDEQEKYALHPGDLVMTEGGDPDKLGRSAIWKGEIEGCAHQNHIFRVRPYTTQILPDYLCALSCSRYGKGYFLSVAKQTTGIASINKTQLGRFPVILPPLALQQEFAERVAEVEGISALNDRAGTTAEQMAQSLLAQVFGQAA